MLVIVIVFDTEPLKIWGFALTAGESQLKTAERSAYAVNTHSSGVRAFLSMGTAGPLNQRPQAIDSFGYSPEQVKYPLRIQGTLLERPFDPAADAFFVRPDSALGQTFAQLGYTPFVWNLYSSSGKISAPN